MEKKMSNGELIKFKVKKMNDPTLKIGDTVELQIPLKFKVPIEGEYFVMTEEEYKKFMKKNILL